MSGYWYAGIYCGMHLYAKNIPHNLPSNLNIPTIHDTFFNTVWYNLGHPLNTQNQPLSGYYQVASYQQNGAWTTNWAIIKVSQMPSGLFIGNKIALLNWRGAVCIKA